MQNSNIQDKDVILSVLSRYSDPMAREAEIKKWQLFTNELLMKFYQNFVVQKL